MPFTCEAVIPISEEVTFVSSAHPYKQTLFPPLSNFGVAGAGAGGFRVTHHDDDTVPGSSSVLLLVVILPPLWISHQFESGLLSMFGHAVSTH